MNVLGVLGHGRNFCACISCNSNLFSAFMTCSSKMPYSSVQITTGLQRYCSVVSFCPYLQSAKHRNRSRTLARICRYAPQCHHLQIGNLETGPRRGTFHDSLTRFSENCLHISSILTNFTQLLKCIQSYLLELSFSTRKDKKRKFWIIFRHKYGILKKLCKFAQNLMI